VREGVRSLRTLNFEIEVLTEELQFRISVGPEQLGGGSVCVCVCVCVCVFTTAERDIVISLVTHPCARPPFPTNSIYNHGDGAKPRGYVWQV
jgi:hypothetical protein